MSFFAILKLKQELDESPPPKDWLDRYLLKSIIKSWGGRGGRDAKQREIVRADIFAEVVLPFCKTKFKREDATIRTVNSEHVMGGHYIGHFPVNTEDLPELLNTLNSYVFEDYHNEQARYAQIGEFPVYVPYEGKNRVTLFRSLKRPIQALVNRTAYPEPELLTLRQVKPFSNCFALELKHDYNNKSCIYRQQIISHSSKSTIAVLTFNESVKVLEEYGVRWGRPVFSLWAPIRKRICKLVVAHRFYRR